MKSIFINPFEIFAEKTLILLGTIATIIGSALGYYLNIRYDGALDLHVVAENIGYKPWLDNVINLISLFITLYIAGKIINKKTRIVDVLTTVLIARIPYYIVPIFNFNNSIQSITKKIIHIKNAGSPFKLEATEWTTIGTFTLFTVTALVWCIALLYNGYKTATNAKGTASIVLFIGTIIVAEVLSKILITQLP